MRRRHTPAPLPHAPVNPNAFWRDAVGPGMQIAASTDRIARLRRVNPR
ncbi:MAG: hypothetical protein RIB65_02030 [Ilumatobacter fluminis]|uniref:Uncharacterized protein n=1 Tax=Ilumatobacter fluminis TaxID=467091 RepID=A0A4R7HYT2_9ACTN|nr:hypothetical protein [Ilumatobacter fluminis]TDT16281.1 hypothetical protein BDK89_1865 [Ilumatobacter fluminis]